MTSEKIIVKNNREELLALAEQVDQTITGLHYRETVTYNVIPLLERTLQENAQIHTLIFEPDLEGERLAEFAYFLRKNKKLTTLTILGKFIPRSQHFMDGFGKALTENTAIEALTFEVKTGEQLEYNNFIIRILKQLKNREQPFTKLALRNMRLCGQKKDGFSDSVIAQSLSRINITELYLTNNTLSQSDARVLICGLKDSKTIKKLDISNNNYVEQPGAFLFETIISTYWNIRLEELHCAFNNFNIEFAKRIAGELEKNPPLKILNINNNPITAKGIKYIFAILPKNTHLQELDVSGIEMTDGTLEVLIRSLEKNKTLIKLNYDKENLRPDLIERVAQLLSLNRGETPEPPAKKMRFSNENINGIPAQFAAPSSQPSVQSLLPPLPNHNPMDIRHLLCPGPVSLGNILKPQGQ